MSRRVLAVLLPLFALFTFGAAVPASADAGGVVRFATLPKPGPGFPEGIAADPSGRIYVATFDFSQPNVIYIFDRNGHLDDTISLPAGVVPLGLEFDAISDVLYVADFGGGNVLQFSPQGKLLDTFKVCGGAEKGCGLNAITLHKGLLYVSDSFGGTVYQVDVRSHDVTPFVTDDLLKPGNHGFPGFGANGLAFDGSGNLYIANTADDRVLRCAATPKGCGKVSVFAESVNGADGITFDSQGRLWVAANQGDHVVALNGNGRLVERVGSFEGIGNDGAAKGLLFPASIVISNGFVYVTNLALPLTPAVGDEPEEDVTTYTVSRFRLPN